MNIEKSIELYIEGRGKNNGRKPNERYASFDYCYNYFYTFYKENQISEIASDENIQMSCLHLGFYLASWGMMRGSTLLIEKSVRYLKELVIAISKMDPIFWEIDVDKYDDKNIQLLLDCKEIINKALVGEKDPTDTLITKIMLGFFASVPAFDQYVSKSLGVSKLNKNSLEKIGRFYDQNKEIIDNYDIHTYDFLTGEETDIIYTKAKIIDMCGFMDR